MADNLSRRLFMQLLGLAGAAAAVPPIEQVLAAPTPEIAPPVEQVLAPCARTADRVFEIFIKEAGGGRWRPVGELQSIEVSLNPIEVRSMRHDRPVYFRGREETTFKIDAFTPDEELDVRFAGAEFFKARVTVEGTTFHMPVVQIVSNKVTLRDNEPVQFTYEGIGFGHVEIEEAECGAAK